MPFSQIFHEQLTLPKSIVIPLPLDCPPTQASCPSPQRFALEGIAKAFSNKRTLPCFLRPCGENEYPPPPPAVFLWFGVFTMFPSASLPTTLIFYKGFLLFQQTERESQNPAGGDWWVDPPTGLSQPLMCRLPPTQNGTRSKQVEMIG